MSLQKLLRRTKKLQKDIELDLLSKREILKTGTKYWIRWRKLFSPKKSEMNRKWSYLLQEPTKKLNKTKKKVTELIKL